MRAKQVYVIVCRHDGKPTACAYAYTSRADAEHDVALMNRNTGRGYYMIARFVRA